MTLRIHRFRKANVATMRLVIEIMAPMAADATLTINTVIEDIICAKNVAMV